MAGVITIFALMSVFYYEYHYYTVEKDDFLPDDDELESPPRSRRATTVTKPYSQSVISWPTDMRL